MRITKIPAVLAAGVTAAALALAGATPVNAAPPEPGFTATDAGQAVEAIPPGSIDWAPPLESRRELPGREFPEVQAKPAVSGEFRELQMNLCNSGYAGCYADGYAVNEGAVMIDLVQPHMVTLNEVCEEDVVDWLAPAMAYKWPNAWVYYTFVPAVDPSGDPITCTTGSEYGVSVIGHVPAAQNAGARAYGGRYTNQDSGSERRAFVCLYAVNNYYGCTTHLTHNSEPIALAQCNELMSEVIPAIWTYEAAYYPTVTGGDLNLEYDTDDPENVQNCVPSYSTRKGDGNVQHIIATNDAPFAGTQTSTMFYTDHNAFIATLTMP